MTYIVEIIVAAFLLFFLQRKIYRKIWKKELYADLSFTTAHVTEGEYGFLQEIIENRKRFPISMLKVKFQTSRHLLFESFEGSRLTDRYYRNDIFFVAGGEKITRTIRFQAGKRGFYRISELQLLASDLFLTEEMSHTYSLQKSLYVYPKCFAQEAFQHSLKLLNQEVISRRHLLEDPFLYQGIRGYQPFDDVRNINWKATAKTDELKVNVHAHTALRCVRIFFDLEDSGILKQEACVEASLQIVAGISQYFLSQGMQVSCYGNGKDILTDEPVMIKAGSGKSHLERIYRTLARIDTSQPTVSFASYFERELLQKTQDSAMTFLVAHNPSVSFLQMVTALQQKNICFHWYYPIQHVKKVRLPADLESHIQLIAL